MSTESQTLGDTYVGLTAADHVAEVRELSRLSVWRGIAQIALEWIGVVAAIALCTRHFTWYGYVAAVTWIGARQHAMAVLMHEAVHYRLWPDKRVNDAIGDCTLAWPLFLSVPAYRDVHFAHHRHVNTPEDPDWVSAMGLFEYRYPKPWWKLAALFVATMVGFGAYRQIYVLFFYNGAAPMKADATSHGQPRARVRIAFTIGLVAALALSRSLPLFFLYWIVPLLTWTRWIVYLRVAAEHLALPFGDLLAMTRTVVPSWIGRVLIAPNNIHYHIEHHLYPSVPFYNLPKLHALLVSDSRHRSRMRVVRSYREALRECVEFRGDAAGSAP